MIQKTLIASAFTLAMLSGCSDSNPADSATDAGNGSTTGNNSDSNNDNNNPDSDNNGGNNPDLQTSERKLQPLNDNEAFYAALREGLIQQNRNIGAGTEGLPVDAVNANVDEESDTDNSVIGTGDAAPSTGDTAGDSAADGIISAEQSTDGGTSGSSGSTSSDVTQTNVQEIGVDEQDRMKSDGEFLYILQNQFNDGYPVAEPDVLPAIEPVNGVPPAEPDVSSEGDSDTEFTIDLLPVSMDGNDVDTSVVSPEWPKNTTKLRILALNNDVPDATPITDLEIDLNGAWADGMYLFKEADKRNLVLTSTSFNEYLYYWDDPYAFNNASSLISKLDVTNPAQSTVGQSVKIDGQIISSRRIDNRLFVATRFYPAVPNVDPYSLSPEEYQRLIESADLTQVLPKITSTDGTTTELVNPAECFVAAKGPSEDYYYTPDIISLSVIDLSTMQLKDSECFLGASEALYATPKSVYLATTRWDYGNFDDVAVVSGNDVETEFYDPRVDTDIHQFSINGDELQYSGSGVVSGHLGWNPTRKPFRMSEKGDYLRIATYSDTQDETVSPIKFSVFNVAGDGELTKVAELPNENNPKHIGKPGEQLYASRFLGDRAYLVTFRQTDPLYVIDASNPEDPKLAGELEIEGYSDYLQPIGEDFLLGIGRDAVPGPVEWGEGALTQGVKLSLFNVSDANNPTEVQSIVVGERGTEAAALQNHRAITIQAATDSHPTRVAFGIDVHGLANPRPVADDPTIWFPWNFSGLHGFDINIGSGAGIEPRGAMVVNSASNPRISSFDYYSDDRAVIVGDAVYYIRAAEVFAATWSDLGNFVGPR